MFIIDVKADRFVLPTFITHPNAPLYKFADICDEPVKDVAERLCNTGAVSEFVVEEIRKWFRRDIDGKIQSPWDIQKGRNGG